MTSSKKKKLKLLKKQQKFSKEQVEGSVLETTEIAQGTFYRITRNGSKGIAEGISK